MGRHRAGRDRPGFAPPAAVVQEHRGPLGATLRRGAAISGFALGMVQTISLLSTLLLARLLTPEEVGVYAAGTVLSGFLVMFAEGGLRAALIQRQGDVEDATATVFWVTAVTGAGMSLVALAVSPLVGWLFDNPLAAEIAAITAGMLLMHGLTNVPDGLLQRGFNFKRKLIVDPARSIAFGAVTIALAASGFGVWSLVIGNYASMAVWLIGTWALAPWRPGRSGRPSLRLWRQLARFAYPLLIQTVVWQIREAGQTALVGRFLGEATLGHFRYGRRVGVLPATLVQQMGGYVLFPAFSRMADDPQRRRRAFLRALRWIWFGAAPLAALIVALGEPAIVVLMGERWRQAGVFLVAMAGYGAAIGLKSAAGEMIKGTGRSQLLNYTSATQLVLGLGLVVAALPFGLFGVGLAISATEMVLAAILLGLARTVVDVSLRELAGALVPPLVGALAGLAAIGPLEHLLVHSDQRPVVLGLALLAAQSLAFAAVYLATMRLVAPAMVADLLAGARRAVDKRRGKPPVSA